MSVKRYCVCFLDHGEHPPWMKEPGTGSTSRRSETYEATGSGLKKIAEDLQGCGSPFAIYRAEDVLSDAQGIAYVRPGAQPVKLAGVG